MISNYGRFKKKYKSAPEGKFILPYYKVKTPKSGKNQFIKVMFRDKSKEYNVSRLVAYHYLLDFIKGSRSLYRDYEDYFVTAISKIVPIKYKQLFLLNSNMSSGVVKKALVSIYNEME